MALVTVKQDFTGSTGDLVQLAGDGNVEAVDSGTIGSDFPGQAVAQIINAEHQVDSNDTHRIIVQAI